MVGQGFGNFDAIKDTAKFYLVDPVERNTFGVPSGGWFAIRFLADNPGDFTSKFKWEIKCLIILCSLSFNF